MDSNERELKFLHQVFKKFDTLNTGYLNSEQFTKLIKTLSYQIPEIIVDNIICEAVFSFYDKDNNKKLSFNEIYTWWISRDKFQYFIGDKAKLMKKARTLFIKYTPSGRSGMIFSEFENLLSDYDLEHDESAFDTIDQDGDGIISFTEFVKWLSWF